MQEDSIFITLVDDDEDDRLFFTDAFEELDINTNVVALNNGKDLLTFLDDPATTLPNIIFLDLNMPLISGIDCLKHIKRDKRLKNIAVAIYSTSSSDQDVENTFVLGADIYIKKPSCFEDLKKILSDIIIINWENRTTGLNQDNFYFDY